MPLFHEKDITMNPMRRENCRARKGPSRREIIVGAGAAATLPLGALDAADFAGVEDRVAEHARALLGGRSVTLRAIIPSGSGANIAPVIAAFSERTGIAVDIKETHVDDINTHLILDTISGQNTFDVALPATFGIPDLVAADALLPLNDLVARYEPAGFRDGILYSTGDRFDDVTYGFQTDGDTYLMFYNSDFLDNPDEQARYGDLTGEALAIPQTWEQLDRQIAFFHRLDDGIHGGALFRVPGYLGWEWWVRFHAKGALPFSDDLEPLIAGAEGVAALEEMIAVTRYLIPDSRTVGLFTNWERFAEGNIYCNIGWGGTQKYLNKPDSRVRGKLTFGPTPGGLVDGRMIATPYFNWGWNYVVSRFSQNAELAYLFCMFAASPAISTQSVGQRDGFFDPFRAEHYDDPTIRDIYGDAFLAVHRHSLENSIPDLYLAHQSEYFLVLNEWIDLALSGSVTPKEALDRIAVEWNLITYRSEKDLQMKRWSDLVAKYPPASRLQ